MKAHRLTMSKMSLAHECTYGFRADVESFPRPPGKEARIGTIFHAMVESHVNAKPIPEPEAGSEHEWAEAHARFSQPLRAYLDSVPWSASESGLRYDAANDVAHPHPRRGEASYADVGLMELAGTLDLVAITPDDALVVDAKSGKLVKNRDQLYVQAVAVSRAFGVSTVRVGYLYGRKTKCDPPELETLDADRLDHEAGRIARVLRRLPLAKPKSGEHCHWCEAKPGCPEYRQAKDESSERELESAGFFGG